MTKKIYHLAICLMLISTHSFAQWGGSSTTTGDIYRSGNVGIGTTTPSMPLTVFGTGAEIALFKNASADNIRICVANNTGQMNLGIGALTPHPYMV